MLQDLSYQWIFHQYPCPLFCHCACISSSVPIYRGGGGKNYEIIWGNYWSVLMTFNVHLGLFWSENIAVSLCVWPTQNLGYISLATPKTHQQEIVHRLGLFQVQDCISFLWNSGKQDQPTLSLLILEAGFWNVIYCPKELLHKL